ncbi:NAD kinase-like [Clavelina lepadiformis]|uniref:NAD(+) kinase n=1 Tax=Clavelina lepadiformis TaxID=159417 RepID=A0ABP0H374_CLALP
MNIYSPGKVFPLVMASKPATTLKGHKKACNGKKKFFKRGKSLLGPLPDLSFGPKALTRQDFARDYVLDPENQTLKWSRPPENILIIKKNDAAIIPAFIALANWLINDKSLNIFVEEAVLKEKLLKVNEDLKENYTKLKKYEHSNSTKNGCDTIDLIITIGGDGTLLYAASLFQSSMPPVIAFHCGSLGFLTVHELTSYKETISNVFLGNAGLMLRSRLRCMIQRKGEIEDVIHKSPSYNGIVDLTDINIKGNGESCHPSFLVLNEVVVNRGQSQFICNIDLYLEGRRITSVQGDGLIISTPTGSTGYAVAAGASMVHPNVPAIMVTPICPHSLSFRPIIVPPGAELKFALSENARGPASVSFDGKGTTEIFPGDYVTIRTSVHPAPCVCKNNPFDDWFDSLSRCLHWNSRQSQKQLDPIPD